MHFVVDARFPRHYAFPQTSAIIKLYIVNRESWTTPGRDNSYRHIHACMCIYLLIKVQQCWSIDRWHKWKIIHEWNSFFNVSMGNILKLESEFPLSHALEPRITCSHIYPVWFHKKRTSSLLFHREFKISF